MNGLDSRTPLDGLKLLNTYLYGSNDYCKHCCDQACRNKAVFDHGVIDCRVLFESQNMSMKSKIGVRIRHFDAKFCATG